MGSRYYSSADAKWRRKHARIKGYGGDEERFQQAVARAIRVLEAFYAEHHEQPIDTDDALLVEHHGVEHHGVESVAESGLP